MNTQHNTRQSAMEYLDLGWSVFPIRPGEKIPRVEWKKYQKEAMSRTDVDRHFRDDDNIAVACGPVSGILVIDEDDYKDRVMELGLSLVSPLMVYTPRGGKHYYFRYKEGVGGNTVNQGLATDIRSIGGYVLLPPSQNRVEGGELKPYLWLVPPTPELIKSLPEAPQKLLEAIYERPKVQISMTEVVQVRPELRRLNVLDHVQITEGGRNDALSRLALSLLNKFKGNVSMALTELIVVNATYTPPLRETEVMNVLRSAQKKYQESPPTELKRMIEEAEQLARINPSFERLPWQDIRSKVVKIFVEGKMSGISTGFKNLDKIVGGYIPGQSYLMVADTNVGKSVFAINSAVDLAMRGHKVLCFDLENSVEMTYTRLLFASMRGALTLPEWRKIDEITDPQKKEEEFSKRFAVLDLFMGNFEVWDLTMLIDRFGDIKWDGVKKCIEESLEKGMQVCFLDHLHYFSPAETNHEYLGKVAQEYNTMAANSSFSAVLIAHTKKGLVSASKKGEVSVMRPTIDSVYGSAMIAKHFKNIIVLKRNPAAIDLAERSETTVYVDKTKYGPAGSFMLRYNEQALCFYDDEGSTNISDFLEKQRVKKEQEELAKEAELKVKEQKLLEDKIEVIPDEPVVAPVIAQAISSAPVILEDDEEEVSSVGEVIHDVEIVKPPVSKESVIYSADGGIWTPPEDIPF